MQFEGATSVAQLLEHMNLLPQKGIAIAVNEFVVPKNKISEHTLHNMDRVLIIKAAQGG